jgi:glucose-6-phosphate isomerase
MSEQFSLGEYAAAIQGAFAEAESKSYVERIWARDAQLWSHESAHRKIIDNALGWLTVAEKMKGSAAEMRGFADLAGLTNYTSAVLLGMGGSSLCPEVCAQIFGTRPGSLDLKVLDTTDPAAIMTVQNSVDLPYTLFIVSSKSGGTIESTSLEKYFYEEVRQFKGDNAGENFVAITDPGTSLEKLSHDLKFTRVFLNPKDIGGRYSALSYFGLVPMALIGLDIDVILERATQMAQRCRKPAGSARENPGLSLGVALGTLARQGRDKATFVLAPEIAPFGYWLEQLIAESTGKNGTGILPIEGEPLGTPEQYGRDRVFIHISLDRGDESTTESALKALETAGHPVLKHTLRDTMDIGGEFFLWEFATAVAGAVLGIDPFDQPNVQESKDNTQRLIAGYTQNRRLDEGEPRIVDGPISIYADPSLAQPRGGRARDLLESFFRQAQTGDYVALMAYIERSPLSEQRLHLLGGTLRDGLKTATTVGFGPRFLHSTGQFHKGGPDHGIFLQITCGDPRDLPVPGEPYTFSVLKRAQALGDLQSLAAHGRRVMRVHIEGDLDAGLQRLTRITEGIFGASEV